jgi:hypothetical protein
MRKKERKNYLEANGTKCSFDEKNRLTTALFGGWMDG